MKNIRNFLSEIIFILVSISYIYSEETGPNIRTAISQKSLDIIKNNLIPSYLNETTIDLKDLIIKQHIDFIGTIKLNITNNKLRFDKINPDQIEVLLMENSTINLNVKDMHGVIDFNYTFKSGFDDRKGTGNVTLKNLQIVVSSRVYAHPNIPEPKKLGPIFKIENIDLISAEVEIKFNDMGKIEKLVQYLVANIQTAFFTLIKNQLSGEFLTKIDETLFNKMVNMPLFIDIPNANLTIDYSLTKSPEVKNKYLELSLNAAIMSRANNISYTGTSVSVPEFSYGVDSIVTYINDYVIQSALYTLFNQNKLDVFINSEKVPILTTFTLGVAIPELYEHYQSTKPVDISLDAKDYPKIGFNVNKTKINADYTADFVVKMNETYSERALVLDTKVLADFNLFLSAGKIKVVLNEIKLDQIAVQYSIIGEVKSDVLATNLNNLIFSFKKVIETSINDELSKFVIPSIAGISFEKSSLLEEEGYVQLKVEMDPVVKSKTIEEKQIKFLE